MSTESFDNGADIFSMREIYGAWKWKKIKKMANRQDFRRP